MIYLLMICITLFVFLFNLYVRQNMKISEKDLIQIKVEEDNLSVCKEMLRLLKNNHTKVEYNKDEKSNLSYYNHSKDVIILKKDNKSSSRITQIAHECIHTIQDKTYLKANRFFSNFQIIYFIITLISMFHVEINELLLISIQLIMLLGTLFVKVVIEGDASYRSVKLAEEYLKNKINKEEKEQYIKESAELVYKLMPVYYFNFFSQGMIMIIINTIVALVR